MARTTPASDLPTGDADYFFGMNATGRGRKMVNKSKSSPAALLADTTLGGASLPVATGDVVTAGGARYSVAATGATDQHLTTAGGVKLKVTAGASGYEAEAFNGDLTALLAAACRTSEVSGSGFARRYPAVFLNPGVYTLSTGIQIGTGQTGDLAGLVLRAVLGTVRIVVADGIDAITILGNANQNIHIEGVTFDGGRRHIRLSNTATTTSVRKIIRDCSFINYSLSAISSEQSDSPHWEVTGSTFLAKADATGTVGIAIGGLLDNSTIAHNRFFRNWVDILLDGAGSYGISGTLIIRENDFINFGNVTKRTNIWMIPGDLASSNGTNSGYGTAILENKFGNENYDGWSRILVATHNTSADTGKARDQLTVNETFVNHRLTGIRLIGNRFSGVAEATSATQYVVESWSAYLGGWIVRENFLAAPVYAVYFAGAPSANAIPWLVSDNLVEGSGAPSGPWREFANYPLGIRPLGQGARGGTGITHPGAIDARSQFASRVSAASLPMYGSATRTAVTGGDIYGGDDLAEVVCPAAGSGIAAAVPSTAGGEYSITVAQIDLCRAASNQVDRVIIDFYNYSSGANCDQQTILLSDTPRTYELRGVLPPANSWQFRVRPVGWTADTATSFRAGRLVGPAVTAGTINGGNIRTLGSGAWNGAHMIMGAYHLWIDSSGRLRIKSGAPTSDTDGTVAGTQS